MSKMMDGSRCVRAGGCLALSLLPCPPLGRAWGLFFWRRELSSATWSCVPWVVVVLVVFFPSTPPNPVSMLPSLCTRGHTPLGYAKQQRSSLPELIALSDLPGGDKSPGSCSPEQFPSPTCSSVQPNTTKLQLAVHVQAPATLPGKVFGDTMALT